MSRQVRQVLEASVAEGYAPGMVALVGRGDAAEVEFVGATAFERGAPMRRDTIFRISSMTKPITAAATMMLVEDGVLALGAPIDRWLPELANRRVLRTPTGPLEDTVPSARPITVEDLLSFRWGLGLMFGDPAKVPILGAIAARNLVGFGAPQQDVAYGPDEWLQWLGELPLMAQPGERWLYTAGSNVLGVLIARASGQSLSDFFRTRIFEPLGMNDTGFHAADGGRLPAAYWSTPDGPKLYDQPPASAWAKPPRFPAGDSGLVSTADDFFAFSRCMLRGGVATDGRRLLNEASVRAMTTDHLTAEQRAGAAPLLDDGQGWGYGVSVHLEHQAGGPPRGAFGWIGGLGTSWIADPASQTTAILLTQAALGGPAAFAAHADFWAATFSHS